MTVRRSLLLGLVLWVAGTAAIRLAPERLLAPRRDAAILLLYAASFAAVFLLVRRARRGDMGQAEARAAVIALVLPTLVLDALAAAFFAAAYPNLPAEAAGVFGGWMMMFCAGGLAAALPRR